MSLTGTHAMVAHATKSLEAAWEHTSEHWTDLKGREFREKYLAPLPEHVQKCLESIQSIEELLRKVRKQCE